MYAETFIYNTHKIYANTPTLTLISCKIIGKNYCARGRKGFLHLPVRHFKTIALPVRELNSILFLKGLLRDAHE